ncbi:MAG: hypothetical protein IKH41_10410 [Clostridia bacterium]|nr:hypothetical protein [Clostridia bacterium]
MKHIRTAALLLVFMIVLATVPAAAAEIDVTPGTDAETEKNYIVNGSFEMGPGGQWGAIDGWTMNIPVGTMNLYIGNYYYDIGKNAFPSETYIALRKESNPDSEEEVSVTQTITDLPVGVYEFSAWMWSASNTDYFVIRLDSGDFSEELECLPGVRDYDSTEIAVKSGTLTITIAADNYDKNRWMDALADDLKLIQIKGEEAFVTPDPTPEPTPTEEPIVTEAPATDAPEVTDKSEAGGSAAAELPKKGQNVLVPVIIACAITAVVSVTLVMLIVKRKSKK